MLRERWGERVEEFVSRPSKVVDWRQILRTRLGEQQDWESAAKAPCQVLSKLFHLLTLFLTVAHAADAAPTSSGRPEEPECHRCRVYLGKMAELNALVVHLAGENLSLKQQLSYYMGKACTPKATAASSSKRKAPADKSTEAATAGTALLQRRPPAPTGMAEAVLALTTLGDNKSTVSVPGSGHEQVPQPQKVRPTHMYDRY
eukprot:1196300-Prorocentrum_minimum.AAC.3